MRRAASTSMHNLQELVDPGGKDSMQARIAALEADEPKRHCEGHGFVRVEAEVMEVVVVSLDPVGVDRPLGRLPAHDFDRHTEAPEVVLVPLEGTPERRARRRISLDPVPDLVGGQRDDGVPVVRGP